MSEALLRVEGLRVALPKGADRPWALDDVSLDVQRGEILCLVGESGSGKSVLASALMGALPRGLRRTQGRVLFGGDDLAALPERRLRALRGNSIAMVFQEPMAALNPALTIAAQVEEVFAIHRPAMSRAERRKRALALLADTHLPDPAEIALRYPHQISGGQCQRVVIAMALALGPKLLVADEPTTALDVTTQAQILHLMRELRDEHGHAVLLVTHDFGVVADTADRIAVMQGGRLVEHGLARQVLDAPTHPYTKSLLAAVPSLVPRRRMPVGDAPAMELRSLSKHYGKVRALDRVTLDIPRGSTVAVVGESGSGKSTLARTVIRLVEPTSGRVLIEDVDFASLPRVELRRRRRLVQMVFQDPAGSLNPRRSVGNLLARAGRLGGLGMGEARSKAAELLDMVGLPPQAADRRPSDFSGGQRQRIGIARALAMRPSIVIADESVSALDVSVQAQVLDLLAELKRRTGMTLLFITHDLRVAAQIADRIAVMRNGQVVEHGVAAEVLLHPADDYTTTLVEAAPGRAWQARAVKEKVV